MGDMIQGLLPLIIGVTGHRDLCDGDREELEDQVRSIFKEIRENHPHIPMILLSPLAEGADRLVARVVLDSGIPLFVPLPMPRTLYEKDFQTSASQAEFNDLIQQAKGWFELPLVEGNTEEDIREHGKKRDLQYEAVGKFIVHNSQILIALWDGEPSELVGGTAQIVDYWLRDFPKSTASLLNPPDPVKSGPLYHIVTPRIKNPNPDRARTRQKLFPEGYTSDKEAENLYQRIYDSIERFNRDASDFQSEFAVKRESGKAYLLPQSEAESLPNDLKFVRELYATADTLALYFQRKTLETLKTLLILAFGAVVFFELYNHIWHQIHALLFFYPVLLCVAFFYYWRAKRGDYQNKYQDYRALAEGLRVQFFWRLAGLNTSVEEHYLGKQRRELDWIRGAIRTCWSITGGETHHTVSPSTVPEYIRRIRLVLKHWVEDQYTYFNKAARRDKEQAELLELLRNSSFWFSLVLAFLMALVLCILRLWLPDFNNRLEHYGSIHGLLLIAIVSLPAVIAAVLYTYAEKKGPIRSGQAIRGDDNPVWQG